jgi:peroxidase
VIDSLQLTDRLKVIATPANWTVSVFSCDCTLVILHSRIEIYMYVCKPEADCLFVYFQPGTKVMILPQVKDEDLPKLFPRGVDKVSMPSGITYVRTTTDY